MHLQTNCQTAWIFKLQLENGEIKLKLYKPEIIVQKFFTKKKD